MVTLVICVHTPNESITLRECATIVTILKEEKRLPQHVSILTEWLMQEECAIVVTKLKNGKRQVDPKRTQGTIVTTDLIKWKLND